MSATLNSAAVHAPAPGLPQSRLRCLLNVTAHLDPSFGGICAILPPLSAAVAAESRARVSIAAFCGPQEIAPQIANVQVERFKLGPAHWIADPAMRQRLSDAVRSADIVHIHGLWREHCTLSARLARKWKKPYMISAHGMAERWAMADKRWKKAVFKSLFEQRNLASAACLHALTQAEVADYRRLGLKGPVAVIPNGIRLPQTTSAELFWQAYPDLRGRPLVLFLGRIHYKKGLDILCRAWTEIRRRCPDAHLVIAGPDSENTQAGIEKLLEAQGQRSSVTFTGMLGGELKWSALRAAQCFVLPSYSEGLSVSVLEAMGSGVPVVITEQCNMPDVRRYQCGIVVQPKEAELAEALARLLSASSDERRLMGHAGRQLVRRSYSWETVAMQMTQVYDWMLGGPVPTHVEVSFRA